MPSIFFLSVGIFFFSYLLILSEKIHRTVVALAGASLMIILGVLSQEQAVEGIDFNTLGLLIGMMVLVGIAKESGIFQAVALYLAKKANGHPIGIFVLLGLIVMIFSALLDNVTTVLLMVPVTIVIANNLKISPYPYLIGTILLSNIGGAMTLIGDPPNILIGSAADLSFNDFLFHLGPICFLIGILTIGLLSLAYRKKLVSSPAARSAILKFSPKEAICDYRLLRHSLIALAVVLIGFMTHGITGLEGATIALGGAALLLILSLRDPEDHLKEIEWPTIFFFVGLFILVSGIESVGLIDAIAEYVLGTVGSDLPTLLMTLLWGSALMSAIVDNIPFVTAMIPLIEHIGELTNIPLEPLWWSLALGADIGGNATLIGASANLVVAGIAKKEGHHMSFFGYMKVAIPCTLFALVIATVYILLRYT